MKSNNSNYTQRICVTPLVIKTRLFLAARKPMNVPTFIADERTKNMKFLISYFAWVIF